LAIRLCGTSVSSPDLPNWLWEQPRSQTHFNTFNAQKTRLVAVEISFYFCWIQSEKWTKCVYFWIRSHVRLNFTL